MKINNKNNFSIFYLGIPGSNSFTAGQRYFGRKKTLIPCKSIGEIFHNLSAGSIDLAVIPLENSITGSIFESYDHLLSDKINIIGEVILRISHHVLGYSNLKKPFHDVAICYSHPQAISQCMKFINSHSWIKPEFTSDTASAVKLISEKKLKNAIAIAGREAAKIYNLSVLSENIEDDLHNYTRFAVIGKGKSETGNKMSLAFSVEHRPGSLVQTLAPYAKAGLNLTKIESRPVFGKPWEYIFFVDIETGGKNNKVKTVLKDMKEYVNFLRILGIYKKGKVYES